MSFLYWPYDEVTLRRAADGSTMTVATPWIEATLALTPDNRANLEALAAKIDAGSLAAEDLGLVNWLFRELDAYPLGYILPAPKSGALDRAVLDDEAFVGLGLPELLKASVTSRYGEGSDIGASDVDGVVERLPRAKWDWDADAALSFAAVGEQIHPESIFSVARRFHLLDVLESNKGRKNFDMIGELQGDAFALAAGLMVRQNHYVTQKCHTSLLPALDKAGQARDAVESFIKEENGHDRILGVAMKSFAPDPETVPATLQTKALMHLLRFAAQRNFLAFAMAIDFFERSSYEKTDPLAQLLMKGGFDKAAKQINRHMDINDAGEHENVGVGLLKMMAPVDHAYAVEALRIAELVTLVMNSVPESAVELYEKLTSS